MTNLFQITNPGRSLSEGTFFMLFKMEAGQAGQPFMPGMPSGMAVAGGAIDQDETRHPNPHPRDVAARLFAQANDIAPLDIDAEYVLLGFGVIGSAFWTTHNVPTIQ